MEDLIRETVTVWLVFYDTADSNGLMRVVGSHRTGMHEHSLVESGKYVLAQGRSHSWTTPPPKRSATRFAQAGE